MPKGIYEINQVKICILCKIEFCAKRAKTLVCDSCKQKKIFCACGCGESTAGLVYRRRQFGNERGTFGFEYTKYILGHGCRGKRFSKEGRKNMSLGQLKRRASGGKEIDAMVEKIRKTTIWRWRHPTEKMGISRSINLSKSMLAQYADGKREPPIHVKKGAYKSGWISTKKGGRIYYRSSWEKKFLQLVDKIKSVALIKGHPIRLPYKFSGKYSTYFVDFLVGLINGLEFLVEIKGYHQSEDQWKAKEKVAKKYCEKLNIPFIVFRKEVTEEDLKVFSL